LRRRLCWDRDGYGSDTSIADPDEDFAALVDRQPLAFDEFDLHILQERVIELKLALEGPICHTLALAQKVHNLIEDCVEVHLVPSSTVSGGHCRPSTVPT
jgi:hypothetical protein